jgi:transcription antitermination factor NusA-like protein
MRTPICKDCAWNEKLCTSCSKKLADGKISPLDVEVTKILYKINETQNISNAEFSKAYEIENVVIIESHTPGLLIGKRGRIISLISLALQKKVRIIRDGSDIKSKIADFVYPLKLLGLNTTWYEGNEIVKIRLEKSSTPLFIPEQTLTKILKEWLKKDIQIYYE